MNYIQCKLIKNDNHKNGYSRATIQATRGIHEKNGSFAKSFFWSHIFKGNIDHGNHYLTNNFIMTKLCLIHFHTRNLDQIKKKVYNNLKGLGNDPFNINFLKQKLIENSICEGNHHVRKQIEILSGTFKLPYENPNENDIDLTPFNNYILNIKQ